MRSCCPRRVARSCKTAAATCANSLPTSRHPHRPWATLFQNPPLVQRCAVCRRSVKVHDPLQLRRCGAQHASPGDGWPLYAPLSVDVPLGGTLLCQGPEPQQPAAAERAAQRAGSSGTPFQSECRMRPSWARSYRDRDLARKASPPELRAPRRWSSRWILQSVSWSSSVAASRIHCMPAGGHLVVVAEL